MNDDQLIKESILSKLKDCGVPVSKLHLSVDHDVVKLTGSVDTFYALQLIQSQFRYVICDRKLTQQVCVTVTHDDAGYTPPRRYLYLEPGLEA